MLRCKESDLELYLHGGISASLFGWSACDWSLPANNESISSDKRKEYVVVSCCPSGHWIVDANKVALLKSPRQHRPKDISKPRRDIHLVEIKYCEDTRPQNQTVQLSWTPQRNSTNTFAKFSKELRYSPHHPFGCGWHHLQHTLWSLSKNWVSILKELRSLPLSSMCTLWTVLLNLSIPDVPFPVLLSNLIRSRFQAKPATLLIPIVFPFLFAVEELYGTWYQSGSFSLFNVGSSFHFLRSIFFFFSLLTCILNRQHETIRQVQAASVSALREESQTCYLLEPETHPWKSQEIASLP